MTEISLRSRLAETCVPSSTSQRMVVEVWLPGVRALTVHLMSLFFLDSSVPFSTTVSGRRSYLTLNRTSSACPLPKPLPKRLTPPQTPPAATTRPKTTMRILVWVPHRLACLVRLGLGDWDPFGLRLSGPRAG